MTRARREGHFSEGINYEDIVPLAIEAANDEEA